MGSPDDILQGVATPGLYDRMFDNLRHPNALATKPVGNPVQAKPAASSADTGVRTPAASPLLGVVSGLDVAKDLKVPPFQPFTSDKTPANANDTRNFTPPTSVPDTVTPLPTGQAEHDRGEQETNYTPGAWPGPFTPALAIKSGFAKEEAADWASLANWMTRGESERNAGAFTELFGGDPWTGSNKDHPYYLGWSGSTYQGKPTSAAMAFQDEAGTWHGIAQRYLNGDTTTTPENQMKGNLLMAADLYKQRTGGRNILADFKAGNVVSIASNLSDQWPTLFGSKGMGGSVGGAGDAAFNQWRQMVHADIESGQRSYERLMAQANAADPMSEEMHHYLRRAMEEGDALSKKYKDLEAKPPTSRTPMEAAAGIAPLLMLFAALGGFASRRPALAAMNATNGFLEGLKQGNDEQFANNVNLWKLHTQMAKEAFDMQTTSIRTIMDDINLTDSEKQHKLQDAFRFWQMDQDLKLARENEWQKVYERQDERERNAPQRELERLHIQKSLEDEADRAKQIRRGSWDLPASKLADYDVALDKKEAELGRPATKEEQNQVKQEVMNKPRIGKLQLTPTQQRENAAIDQAQKEIGDLPNGFDDELMAAQESRKVKDVATLTKQGWSPKAISLYRGLLNPSLTGTKTPADDALMKKYLLSQKPKFEPPQVIMNDAGTPTGIVGGGARAQSSITKEDVIAAVRADSDAGESPEAIKSKALQISDQYGLGITGKELDQIIKGGVKTPTGSAARPPQVFPLAPNEDPVAIGLTPYM